MTMSSQCSNTHSFSLSKKLSYNKIQKAFFLCVSEIFEMGYIWSLFVWQVTTQHAAVVTAPQQTVGKYSPVTCPCRCNDVLEVC